METLIKKKLVITMNNLWDKRWRILKNQEMKKIWHKENSNTNKRDQNVQVKVHKMKQ